MARSGTDAALLQIHSPVEGPLRRVVVARRLQLLAVLFAPAARENVLRVGVDPVVVRVREAVEVQPDPVAWTSSTGTSVPTSFSVRTSR